MGFPGTGKIWMNGRLVEWKDATIHIASHVIHYGSGVFEGARCYATPKGSACFRLDVYGNVSEGSGQNIFIVRDGALFTPPISASILGGITRDSIITLARDLS